MKYRYFSLLFLFILTILSCRKPDQFPIVPVIDFKSMYTTKDASGVYDDKLTVLLNFTDGDGDIGYKTAGENGSIYDDPASIYYHNYVATLYWYHNNVWKHVIPHDTTGYGGRIPYLTPVVANKSLKGEIQCDFLLSLLSLSIDYPNVVPVVNDTFRFDIFIYDRALHMSNIVSTPSMILTTQ